MFDFGYFIWQEILYRPIYNLFILFYHFTPGPNVGWAVIGLAVTIRILFLNSSLRGFQTDVVMSNLEPYIDKISEEEEHNPKERRRRITELLKGKKINLYHEVYVILAQLVFLIILYRVFQYGFYPEGMKLLYKNIPIPTVVNTVFLGFDLSKPNAFLSFFTSFILFIELIWEYNVKKNAIRIKFSEKWFPLLLAIFSYILLVILPSAKALFILVSVLFSLGLRIIVNLSRAKNTSRSLLPEPST